MQKKRNAALLLPILFVLVITSIFPANCNRVVDQPEPDPTPKVDHSFGDGKDNLSDEQIESVNQSSVTPLRIDQNADGGQVELAANQVRDTNHSDPDTNLDTGEQALVEQFDFAKEQLALETRAVWSWAGRRKMPDRKNISTSDVDELVAKVDAAHLNVILLSVYKHGTAFFEPSHSRFSDDERLSNQSALAQDGDEYDDALSYLLAIRDERRLDNDPTNDFEVHAWFNVHSGGRMKAGQPPEDRTEPYILHALFPEFRLKRGIYYTEGEEYIEYDTSVIHQPRFRAYMADLIAGLVEDYDVDGVHLDNIRTGGICFNNEPLDYPGTAYDYPGCQEAYKAWTWETYGREYTLWEDTDGNKEIRDDARSRVAAWQQRGMGLLVKSIHDEVKAIRPDVIISVASVQNDTSQTSMKQLVGGQIAWWWLDQGWIDAIFATTYTHYTGGVVVQIQEIRDVIQNKELRLKVFPGLITFSRDDPNQFLSHLIVEQVNAVMYSQWADDQPLKPPTKGVALFLDRRLSEEAIQALAEGPFKEPARPFWGE